VHLSTLRQAILIAEGELTPGLAHRVIDAVTPLERERLQRHGDEFGRGAGSPATGTMQRVHSSGGVLTPEVD
jgi:hypothetical protein